MTSENTAEIDVPFETTEGGYYAVNCPVDTEQYPDEVSMTYDGRSLTSRQLPVSRRSDPT